MNMIKEFKAFALRGNVIDLAIGVVIGAAFNGIISSLISDVITPMILKPALDAAHLTNLAELTAFGTIKYGSFLASTINFVIVAFALFILIKAINAIKRKEEAAITGTPSNEEKLLTEIRDLLKK